MGILLAAIALVAIGYRQGGNSARTALEAFQAAQAENTAKAVLAERAAGKAELDRVNTVLARYQNETLHPVDLHIGQRLLVAACPTVGPVPEPHANTGATESAPEIADIDPRLGPAIDRVIADCQADALTLSALQAAWPR